MLSTKEVIAKIEPMMIDNVKTPHVEGNGIITTTVIGFDKKKMEETKIEIANILSEIGVDEKPLISLATLTKLKNDETWNKLNNMEDFHALELLLACSDACGFITNDVNTKILNINTLGSIPSVLISADGMNMFERKEWLRMLRETVINNMYFMTNPELIKSYAIIEEEVEEEQMESQGRPR